MMDADLLFSRYLDNPGKFGASARQSQKLSKRLQLVNGDRDTAVRMARGAAKRRNEEAAPTIYLVNAGSSGSHWAQDMLSAISPVLACGEVYLPDRLLRMVDGLAQHEQSKFMQLVYAVHGWTNGELLYSASAINTAHKPDPRRMMNYEKGARAILLIRDPVDIVISRTFRKNEYREAIGHNVSTDEAYLHINIDFVCRFFDMVELDVFDSIIRYETLKNSPLQGLRTLASAVGVGVSEQLIADTAREFSAERLRDSTSKGNLYQGPQIVIPEQLISAAASALESVRLKLGYIS